jgi:6-phosphogluconolactonase
MSDASQLNNHPERIMIAPSAEVLTYTAAGFFTEIVNGAIKREGRASVALSGGGTPRALFALLAEPDWREAIDWSRVHVFWGDERFVPPDDAQSNFGMANESLLSKVPIPQGNVHRFMTERGSAAEVAEEYENTIRGFFGTREPEFDFNLLGLGANTHTASLFPETTALKETKRLVVANWVDEIGRERLTFTASLINAGKTVCFMVGGDAKAAAVRDVLIGPMDPMQKPAQLVRPIHGALIWLLDADAAKLLPPDVQK